MRHFIKNIDNTTVNTIDNAPCAAFNKPNTNTVGFMQEHNRQ